MSKGFCKVCTRDSESLHIHHISYFPEKTIQVCNNCHSKIHNGVERYKKYAPGRERPEKYPEQGTEKCYVTCLKNLSSNCNGKAEISREKYIEILEKQVVKNYTEEQALKDKDIRCYRCKKYV